MTLRVELMNEDGAESADIDEIAGLMSERGVVPRIGEAVAGRTVASLEWLTGGHNPARPMLVVRVTLGAAPTTGGK